MNNPDFERHFYSTFTGNILIKSAEENGKWIVYLQASNEGLDQEEEVILCKALKDASDYFMSHGVLSWDHQQKSQKNPAFIIGEPLDVAFTKNNETLVKGWLYQKNEIAKSVWDNIQSGAKKLGASVGGGILRKSKQDDKGIISRVVWDELAITNAPVNDMTLGKVQVVPFREFAKALSAGVGTDASSFSGGRALTAESLQGSEEGIRTINKKKRRKTIPYEEARKAFDGLYVAILNKSVRSTRDVKIYFHNLGYSPETTKTFIEFVEEKLKA